MPTTVLTTRLLEHQTALYSFTLVDEDDVGIDGAQLTTLILTYYDQRTGEIINGRVGQDVHNLNGVAVTTITTTGPAYTTTVTWTLTPNDTVLVDGRHEVEQHIALFEWTWGGGTRHDAHEVQFGVEQLTYVT